MAEDIGALVVRFEANMKNFNTGIEQVGEKANKLGSNIKKLGGTIAAAFAVKAIIGFGSKLLIIASDAEEMQNKFNTVFGDMSNAAEDWAATFRDAVGGSKTEIKGMLANTQDLLTGFGATTKEAFDFSTKIQALGTDLSSFQNLSGGAEEAVDRLRRGLLGETENLKAMGIVINENTMKQKLASEGDNRRLQDLTELEKIELRYKIAVDQSKNAIGDAEKTKTSYANAVRDLKGQITDLAVGFKDYLLPGATKAVTFLTENIPVIKESVTDAFAKIGETIKPIYDVVMPALRDIFQAIVEKIQEWMPTIKETFQSTWDAIKAILDLLMKAFEFAWPFIKDVVMVQIDTIGNVIGGFLKVLKGVTEFVSGVFTGDWRRAWGGIKDIFGGTWDAITGMIKGAINQITVAINLLIRGMNKIKVSIPEWLGGGSFGINIPEIPKLEMGTNFVPFDTAAFLHKGEAIIPRKNNPAAGGSLGGGVNVYIKVGGSVVGRNGMQELRDIISRGINKEFGYSIGGNF